MEEKKKRVFHEKIEAQRSLVMSEQRRIVQVEDYEQFVGRETIERIKDKAKTKTLQHLHVVNVNSTYYGGGVAEMLSSLTLLMNSAGI